MYMIHVHMHVHTHVHVYLCMHISIYIYIYMCINENICMRIHIHNTYTYICMCIYTHTHDSPQSVANPRFAPCPDRQRPRASHFERLLAACTEVRFTNSLHQMNQLSLNMISLVRGRFAHMTFYPKRYEEIDQRMAFKN